MGGARRLPGGAPARGRARTGIGAGGYAFSVGVPTIPTVAPARPRPRALLTATRNNVIEASRAEIISWLESTGRGVRLRLSW